MPKHDLIAEDIKWCEAHRNPAEEIYQDGFIAGLRHALFLMKSTPLLRIDHEAEGEQEESPNERDTGEGWGPTGNRPIR